MSTTVVLVDDRPEMRAVLRAYLALNFRPGLLVAGEAADGSEAVRMCEALRPDVVVLGDELPVLGGPAAIPAIRRVSPGTFVILRRTSSVPAELLHPADRQVDRDAGLGPLGDALAEAMRATEAEQADGLLVRRRVVGGD
jgi:chemotaxis response regulator CheB